MIKLGDRGAEVNEVIDFLVAVGMLDGKHPYFDPEVKEAVCSIQRKLGCDETGVWVDDYRVLYNQENPPQIMLFARNKASFSVDDTVKIIGDNAFYGGLSTDYGMKVPEWVKKGTYTIMQVSEKRQEALLKEIYSWVPYQFLKATSEAPSKKNDTPSKSDVPSTIVTNVKPQPSDNYDKTRVPYPVASFACYILNLKTNEQVTFYTTPETVSDSMSASYEDQTTKSRSSPFKAYANSGPRSVSFSVTLSDDYCPEGLMTTIKKLQRMVLPHKTGGYVEGPEVKVKVGNMVDMTAVMNSVSVEYQKPYHSNGVYQTAEVSFDFNQIEGKSSYDTTW